MIAQGNDEITRKGRQIATTNVYIRGSIEANVAGTGTSDPAFCTCWLVYDKNPNGALATATEFLAYGDGSGHPSHTFLNMSNSDRFIILRRESWLMGPSAKGGASNYQGSPTTGKIDWSLDFSKQPLITTYIGTGAGATAIESGNIIFMFCNDNATGDGWKCTYHARIRFTDC